MIINLIATQVIKATSVHKPLPPPWKRVGSILLRSMMMRLLNLPSQLYGMFLFHVFFLRPNIALFVPTTRTPFGGAFGEHLGSIWWSIWEAFGEHFGEHLGEHFGSILEAFGEHLGSIWGAFWVAFRDHLEIICLGPKIYSIIPSTDLVFLFTCAHTYHC